MGAEIVSLADLMKQAKEIRDSIKADDEGRSKIIEDIKNDVAKWGKASEDVDARFAKITESMLHVEKSVNDLWKHAKRPGNEHTEEVDRKGAFELLQLKHELKVPKKDPEHLFNPSEEQIAEAAVAVRAIKALMNTPDGSTLSNEFKKSLTAFNFGSNGFILAPEMNSRILSCLTEETDLSGLASNMTIAGPSVRFLIDQVRLTIAAWACETSCFANNPQPDLQDGLGEMEIKPETLRYIVCASRDLLEDASINVESWMIGKVNQAFRIAIHNAMIWGTGVGQPMGILNPNAGIPVCDAASTTAPGQFTWQDLIMLKYQVPAQWFANGSYIMNQNTFALLLTMSDANGRPMLASYPQDTPQHGFMLNGSPIIIATQMPDVAPGATPVAFGNWREAYMVVNRKAVTMQQDPYSAGFCILYKFEARVGGGILCPNAARLLRIR